MPVELIPGDRGVLAIQLDGETLYHNAEHGGGVPGQDEVLALLAARLPARSGAAPPVRAADAERADEPEFCAWVPARRD